ncbi:MAG TPA: 2OG-Fe(II) oxygenase family protein [Candidatus Paceibacterota bacterium]|nr:2OG-Fe(II) oxygenase family protein [Candidatus Paceibacterota bacterium]
MRQQSSVLKKTPLLVREGRGPALGSVGRAAIALLARETPILLRVDGLERVDVLGAKDGLFRFDAETPRELQQRWEFHIPRDPEYDEPDDGIIRKAKTDWKVFLHYRRDLRAHLHARNVTLLPWQEEWFASCERIHIACTNSLVELAGKMDLMRPGYRFAERVHAAMDQHVLRILKYEPREGDLARCHTDRCAVTFHIAESADGLHSRQGWDWMPVKTPLSPGVLCFSGKQLESVTEGAVPALYHEVVDTTGGSRARWAMVFFGKMRKDPGMY